MQSFQATSAHFLASHESSFWGIYNKTSRSGGEAGNIGCLKIHVDWGGPQNISWGGEVQVIRSRQKWIKRLRREQVYAPEGWNQIQELTCDRSGTLRSILEWSHIWYKPINRCLERSHSCLPVDRCWYDIQLMWYSIDRDGYLVIFMVTILGRGSSLHLQKPGRLH
jgi:hypothetical protein